MKVYNNFLVYSGSRFSVYFHAKNAKISTVYEYYKKCDAQTRANLLYLVKKMVDHGRIYDITKFRIEEKTHKIYTFKAKKERFFCFFRKNKLIIIANAYRKKSQKIDQKELTKSIKILQLYERSNKK